MLKSGLYNIAGEVLRKALALATIPVLRHWSGTAEYGLFAIVSAIVNLFALPEQGLSISATVAVSRELGSDDRKRLSQTVTASIATAFVSGLVLALLLFLTSRALSLYVLDLSAEQQSNMTAGLRAGAIWVFARLLQQIFVSIQQACDRYALLNTLSTVQAAAASIGIMVIAMHGGNTAAMIEWQAAVGVVAMLANAQVAWLLLRKYEVKWSLSAQHFRTFVSNSFWNSLTTLGAALFSQADRIVVGHVLNTSVAGTYDAITKVTSQINTFSGLSVQPLLPDLSGRLSRIEQEYDAIVARVKQATQVNALVALWLGAAMFVLAPEILRVILGTEVSAEALLSFRAATIIYAIYSINAPGYFMLLALEAVRLTSSIVLSSAVGVIAMIWLGAQHYGLLGAACGNVVYLGTWLLTIMAMERVKVPTKTWTSWLVFPMLWFGAVVSVTCVTPEPLPGRLIAIICGTFVLGAWLIKFEKTIAPALLKSSPAPIEKP